MKIDYYKPSLAAKEVEEDSTSFIIAKCPMSINIIVMARSNINNIEKRLACQSSFNQINSLEMLIPDNEEELENDESLDSIFNWKLNEDNDEKNAQG